MQIFRSMGFQKKKRKPENWSPPPKYRGYIESKTLLLKITYTNIAANASETLFVERGIKGETQLRPQSTD